MTRLAGGVAVVTGAAGGIGRSLVMALARQQMSLVISDLHADQLADLEAAVLAMGTDCLALRVDVTDAESVAALAEQTWQRFGTTTLVCSNAGVMIPGAVWEVTAEHWRSTLNVNVLGTVHLAREFIPRMIEDGRPGHLMLTVGLIGLFTSAFSPPGSYAVSKHAEMAYAEVLHQELSTIEAPIGVTALMPAGVRTGFAAGRQAADGPTVQRPDVWPLMERLQRSIGNGMEPDDVAAAAVEAVLNDEFWVFTHPEAMTRVQRRFDYITSQQPPVSPYAAEQHP